VVRRFRQVHRIPRSQQEHHRAKARGAIAGTGARGEPRPRRRRQRIGGLKAAIRAGVKRRFGNCGRYFRVDEKAGVLRFADAWSVPDPASSALSRHPANSLTARRRVVGPGMAVGTAAVVHRYRKDPRSSSVPGRVRRATWASRHIRLSGRLGWKDDRRAQFRRPQSRETRGALAAGGTHDSAAISVNSYSASRPKRWCAERGTASAASPSFPPTCTGNRRAVPLHVVSGTGSQRVNVKNCAAESGKGTREQTTTDTECTNMDLLGRLRWGRAISPRSRPSQGRHFRGQWKLCRRRVRGN